MVLLGLLLAVLAVFLLVLTCWSAIGTFYVYMAGDILGELIFFFMSTLVLALSTATAGYFSVLWLS